MPHECTNCGRTFPDGSKEMLSGCPDCGGNKFQFAPSVEATAGSGASNAATAKSADASTESAASGTSGSGATEPTGTVERAAETVRDWVSSDTETSTASNAKPTQSPADEPTTDSETRSATERQRPWPSSDDGTDGSSSDDEPGEFEEWPDTARRPEDRSTPPADAAGTASQSSTSTSSRSARSSSADATADTTTTDTVGSDVPSSNDRSIMADSENDAQADARSAVVSSDDLPDGSVQRDSGRADAETGAPETPDRPVGPADGGDDEPPADGRVVSEPSGEQPSIEELREELNEQFESIKIVSPGQYELNLMELYNREEYIISLQEDGRYVIEVPDSWRADDE